eukprot:1159524-Pelagomonas_calceolata.AAC.4
MCHYPVSFELIRKARLMHSHQACGIEHPATEHYSTTSVSTCLCQFNMSADSFSAAAKSLSFDSSNSTASLVLMRVCSQLLRE